ncbi:MAG: dihydroorotase [Leptospiraceae bacterium]|nr:dihydroorotase [Leptospiraceae bacterium]MDW8306052.1 dihydroorotase [Leptospiraceae bacterium]
MLKQLAEKCRQGKRIVISGGTVVTSCHQEEADVLIEEGKVKAIGRGLSAQADEVIDARFLYVLPGLIDTQVHFRDPGFPEKEDLYSGSRAAAAGGITSFLEMPNTRPPTTDFAAMAEKKARAAQLSLVNYNFYAGATAENLTFLNEVPNIPGIKIFMGSSTGELLVDQDEDLERIFAHGRRLIAVHAEDEELLKKNKASIVSPTIKEHPKIRSVEVALRATQKAVGLAKKYRRRLHILHLSTGDEALYLAREKTSYISVEVTPQHLFFSAPEVYEKLGSYAQMNPPIREKWHRDVLRRALIAGVIDCVATDHAPHTIEEKERGYPHSPSGMPGVETSLAVMLTLMHEGLWSLEQVVRWMAESPAKLFGLKGKGFLFPGYDADIVLVDLKKNKKVENGKLYTRVNWSPYHGLILRGWPILTMVGGHVVFREGEFFEDCRGREIEIEAEWEYA